MKDVEIRNINKNAEDWENELWSYINAGDGIRCPLTDSCQKIKTSSRCLNNEKEKETLKAIHKFIDIDDFNIDHTDCIVPTTSFCDKCIRIFKLITKLAEKYRNSGRDNSLPIPNNLILKTSDNTPIEIRYLPLKANHGSVWRLNNCWVIQINNNDTVKRQRFTLYHEIFHTLAHIRCNPTFKKTRSDEVFFNEMLADHFSANILLPTKLVLEKWAELRDINKMANVFSAPIPIIFLALRREGLI